MSSRDKKSRRQNWFVLVYVFFLIGLGFLIKHLISGKNVALLNPKGTIADEQFKLILFVVIVLFAVAIPSLSLLYFVAWRYRESNSKSTYAIKLTRNKTAVAFIWLVPISIMIIISSVMVPATRRLAPQKEIASSNKPLTIQVITLRWKWLFLYPEQQIATVNFVQLPVNTPVTFEMTADETPMSSFWIPNLAGQLYTMTSHENRLNIMAQSPGDYTGRSAELNGAGFSGMTFTARASSLNDFNSWVEGVKKAPEALGYDEYDRLLQPSENNPPAEFSAFQNDIFGKVISKYYQPVGEGV